LYLVRDLRGLLEDAIIFYDVNYEVIPVADVLTVNDL
jgi:hypothetical protein